MVDLRPVRRGHRRRARRRCRGVGNGRRVEREFLGHAVGEGPKLHPGQEIQQRVGFGVADLQRLEAEIQRRLAVELHQPFRDADLVGVVQQGLAPLGLLDLLGIGEQVFQIAVFVDQQRRRLDPDAGRAGDVVDAVAGQRLNVDDAVGADAEFVMHLVRADLLGLDRVQHHHAAADKLHQILVGTDDRDPPARIAGLTGEGSDDVVGLVMLKLDTGDVEGAGGVAGQRELRHQLFRQGRAIGLVVGIDLVAEGLGRVVEDHRHMGRRIAALGVLRVFPQHVGKPRDRPDGQPVGFPRQRRQRVKRAEDKGRAVDQMQVMTLAKGVVGHARFLFSGAVEDGATGHRRRSWAAGSDTGSAAAQSPTTARRIRPVPSAPLSDRHAHCRGQR